MSKFLHTILLPSIKNDHGVIFPYFFLYLVIISTVLTAGFLHVHYQAEQLDWSQKQLTIQNLIQTTLYEFKHNMPTIRTDSQSITYNYETGQVEVEYVAINDTLIDLHMIVTIENEINYEHMTKIVYNVDNDSS
ncbi:hypothetical protein ABID56_002407 [Alkalibacillus flavidus]|uniref:ComG operon protein 7 n=1 Tax=Alkalibacillus flavidus TaxID=546021 RepID=A0ABV2L0D7_9BACI